MTIDEAIKHCEEKAEEQEYVSQIIVELHHEESEREHKAACDACAADHRQLAEWLTELKELKAADVQPVKHGKWVYYKNNGIFDTHKCTLCGEKYEMYMDIEPTTIYKYCPNCGARMDGDTNGYMPMKP